MVDFSKYPNVKRIMDETGATIEEIYQVIEKLELSQTESRVK